MKDFVGFCVVIGVLVALSPILPALFLIACVIGLIWLCIAIYADSQLTSEEREEKKRQAHEQRMMRMEEERMRREVELQRQHQLAMQHQHAKSSANGLGTLATKIAVGVAAHMLTGGTHRHHHHH